MKKGVFAKLISVVVLVMFFSLLVFADNGDITGPGRGESGGGDDTSNTAPGAADSPTMASDSYDADPGYWKPCIAEGEGGCSYTPYSSDDPTRLGQPDLDLRRLYDDFEIISGSEHPTSEVTYVKFVLDALMFNQGDFAFSSHARSMGDMPYEDFRTAFEGGVGQGGCLFKTNIDNLDEDFIPDPANDYYPNEFDLTCVEVDLLNNEDCSDISDFNGPFCEGVIDVGDNAGLSEIYMPGHPGFGGCKELLAPESAPGRDWFNADDVISYGVGERADREEDAMFDAFSGYYLSGRDDREELLRRIGRCCGNDPLDMGALMQDIDDYPNFYLCTRDENQDFVWMPAAVNDKVGWIWNQTLEVDDKTYRFDAVSNTDNWFVCDSPDSLEGIYEDADLGGWAGGVDVNGPLLQRYETPPAPFGGLEYGTTSSIGEEEVGAGPLTGEGDEASVPGEDSKSGFADQSDFENTEFRTEGATESTPCDKDGDGFDGMWTRENPPSEPGWMTDPEGECSSPSQPYDCDDSRSDINPGMIDYCDTDNDGENTDNDCSFDGECVELPDGDKPEEGEGGKLDRSEVYSRFMCHQSDDAGMFAECCSYNLDWCINYMRGTREGGPVNTLNDFSHYANRQYSNDSNTILKYAVSRLDGSEINLADAIENNKDFRLGLPKLFYESEITNWSSYEYLDFYIWTTTNFVLDIGLGKLKSQDIREDRQNLFKNYVIKFREPVIKYVVNGPGLRKWMHVKIPVEDIYGEDDEYQFPVEMIVFFTNVKDLRDLNPPYGPVVRVDWDGDGVLSDGEVYSNFIGIDKFHLTPEREGGIEGDNNYYCGGVWPPEWVGELDDAEPALAPVGREACNAIPSYGWTGDKCCGDDTGWDIAETGHAETSFREFFTGSDAGCWAGNLIVEDERAMLVKYGMYYGVEYPPGSGDDMGIHQVIDRDCSRSTCVFSIPYRAEMFLSNPYPELYDIVALQGGERVVLNQSYLPGEPVSELKAENVPLQVQYREGQFWACNPADYMKEMTVEDLSDDDGEPLFAEDGTQFFGSCEVKGRYFCGHVNGTNMGWSDEVVYKYPLSNNITFEDGSIYEPPSDTISPTYRTEPKTAYNLIINPGFEEV